MLQRKLDPGDDLYYGNLLPDEAQFASGRFVGLAFAPKYPRDIRHDAYDRLALPDDCIRRIQSQDVFEHLEYERIPAIFDDIHRVLAPGGMFRLSLPDYLSAPLRRRSVFDANGQILGDLMMGAKVGYDSASGGVAVRFTTDGDAHVWFPDYQQVARLILRSSIRFCRRIEFHHYHLTASSWVCNPFPDEGMPVMRAPPRDMRANGAPVSLIVDFLK